MTRWRVGAWVVVFALAAGEASAYPLYTTGTQVRGNAFAWRYSGLGSNGAPWSTATLSAADVRTAILASFQDLTSGGPKDQPGAACSTLALTETGGDGGTAARVNDQDGLNVQGIFISASTDPLYPYVQGGVVAFASPVPDSQGYVRDCDTAYNAVDMVFANNGNPNAVDLMAVAQQETAHCFGLHHVCRQSGAEELPSCNGPGVDTSSVMFPFAGGGPAPQHPNARDQDNMCQLYPVNGVGRPCDKADFQNGTGFTQSDCQLGTACGCTSVGAVCTLGCGADAGGSMCPQGSVCDGTGQCIPNFRPGTLTLSSQVRTIWSCGRPPGSADVGSPCDENKDCGTGMTCLASGSGGYCSIACSSISCPSGTGCLRGVIQPNDAYCVQLCAIPSGACNASACRPGLVCQYIGAGRTGACWPGCTSDADCDSSNPPAFRCEKSNGLCYRVTQAPLCTGPATTSCNNAACPAGSVCDTATGSCVKRLDAGAQSDAGVFPDAGGPAIADAGELMDAGAAPVILPAVSSDAGGSGVIAGPGVASGCGCSSGGETTAPVAGVLMLLLALLSRQNRRAQRREAA